MDDELHAMERRLVALRRRKDATEAVCVERERQGAKWGEQNHPMVARKGVDGFGYTPCARRLAEHYETPTATRAKFMCDVRAKRGGLTWVDIASEEQSEFIEAALEHGDLSDEAREEAVQCAAVWLAIIECIDRKRAAKGGNGE